MSDLDVDSYEADAAETAALDQINMVLALSIISIFFFCILGFIATFFAFGAKRNAEAGNIPAAVSNLNAARTTLYVEVVIFFIGLIMSMIYLIFW